MELDAADINALVQAVGHTETQAKPQALTTLIGADSLRRSRKTMGNQRKQTGQLTGLARTKRGNGR